MGFSHGTIWTDKKIREDVLSIVNALGLTHFPTHTDMISFYGNRKLAVKISKSGGTRAWAKKLNLPIKQCESEFGNEYELLAIKEIHSRHGYKCKQTKPRYPYDILVNENIKIDVKVSYPFKNNCNAFANTFNLEKKDPTCDLFIFFCLDMDGELSKTLIIPSCALSGKTQIGVGSNSKYDIYLNKWGLIQQYNDFYQALIS